MARRKKKQTQQQKQPEYKDTAESMRSRLNNTMRKYAEAGDVRRQAQQTMKAGESAIKRESTLGVMSNTAKGRDINNRIGAGIKPTVTVVKPGLAKQTVTTGKNREELREKRLTTDWDSILKRNRAEKGKTRSFTGTQPGTQTKGVEQNSRLRAEIDSLFPRNTGANRTTAGKTKEIKEQKSTIGPNDYKPQTPDIYGAARSTYGTKQKADKSNNYVPGQYNVGNNAAEKPQDRQRPVWTQDTEAKTKGIQNALDSYLAEAGKRYESKKQNAGAERSSARQTEQTIQSTWSDKEQDNRDIKNENKLMQVLNYNGMLPSSKLMKRISSRVKPIEGLDPKDARPMLEYIGKDWIRRANERTKEREYRAAETVATGFVYNPVTGKYRPVDTGKAALSTETKLNGNENAFDELMDPQGQEETERDYYARVANVKNNLRTAFMDVNLHPNKPDIKTRRRVYDIVKGKDGAYDEAVKGMNEEDRKAFDDRIDLVIKNYGTYETNHVGFSQKTEADMFQSWDSAMNTNKTLNELYTQGKLYDMTGNYFDMTPAQLDQEEARLNAIIEKNQSFLDKQNENRADLWDRQKNAAEPFLEQLYRPQDDFELDEEYQEKRESARERIAQLIDEGIISPNTEKNEQSWMYIYEAVNGTGSWAALTPEERAEKGEIINSLIDGSDVNATIKEMISDRQFEILDAQNKLDTVHNAQAAKARESKTMLSGIEDIAALGIEKMAGGGQLDTAYHPEKDITTGKPGSILYPSWDMERWKLVHFAPVPYAADIISLFDRNGEGTKANVDEVYSWINKGKTWDAYYEGYGTKTVPYDDFFWHAEMMTPKERDIFMALYNDDKKGEAMAFIRGLAATNNQRAARYGQLEEKEMSRQVPFTASAASVGMTLAQPVEFFADLIGKATGDTRVSDANSEIFLYTKLKSHMRQFVTNDIDDKFWKTVYNSTMSGGDCFVNAFLMKGTGLSGKMLEWATLALFSTEAFQTSMQQKLEETGGNWEYSAAWAAFDAIIETGTEVFSIEALLSDPSNFIMYVLKCSGSEMSEEVAGSMFGPIIHRIANGKNEWSQRAVDIWETAKKNGGYYYNDQGEKVEIKSTDDATRQAMREWGGDIFWSGLGGAMSVGPAMGRATAHQAMNYAEMSRVGENINNYSGNSYQQNQGPVNQSIQQQTQQQGRNESQGMQELLNAAKNMPAESESYKLASKLQARIDNGKGVSNASTGKLAALLMQEGQSKIGEDVKINRRNVIDEKLHDSELSTKEQRYIGNLVERAYNEGMDSLSRKEQRDLKQSKAGMKVYNELQNQVDQETIENRIKDSELTPEQQKRISGLVTRAYNEGMDSLSETEQAELQHSKAGMEVYKELQENNPLSETSFEVIKRGLNATRNVREAMKTTQSIAFDNNSRWIQQQGMEQKERGEVQSQMATEQEKQDAKGEKTGTHRDVIVHNENGEGEYGQIEGVKDGKVQVRVNNETREMDLKDVRTTDFSTAAILRQQETMPEFYSDRYVNKMLELQDNGKIENAGKFLAEAMQIRTAAFTGTEIRPVSMPAEAVKVLHDEALKERDELRQKDTEGRNAGKNKTGKITFKGTEYGTYKFSKKLKDAGLSKKQIRQVEAVAAIAQRAGIDVQFKTNEEIARPLSESMKDKANRVQGSESGSGIMLNVGSIYNPNMAATEDNQRNMVVTLGHEMTHWLQRNTTDGYNRVMSFVMSEMQRKGINIGEEIQNKILSYKEGGQTLDLHGAISEIVADACDQILLDENVQKHIEESRPGLAKQIKNFVTDLVNRVKKAMNGERFIQTSWESRALLEKTNELAKVWLGAYDEAISGQLQEIKSQTETERKSMAVNETISEAVEEMRGTETFTKLENVLQETGEIAALPARYSFAGIKASAAYAMDVKLAMQMEKDGYSRQEIMEETGCVPGFRNTGRWWKVIDNGSISQDKLGSMQEKQLYRLADVFDANDLFRAYPEMENIGVIFDEEMAKNNAYAAYDEGGMILMNPVLKEMDLGFASQVIRHEVQHAIQHYEGSNNGSSTAYWQQMQNIAEARIVANNEAIQRICDDYAIDAQADLDNRWQFRADGSLDRSEYTAEEWRKLKNIDAEDLGAIRELVEDSSDWTDIVDMDAGYLYWNTVGEIEARAAEGTVEEQMKGIRYTNAVAAEEYSEKSKQAARYSFAELSHTDEEYAAAVKRGDIKAATDMLMDKLKHSENITPYFAPEKYSSKGKGNTISNQIKGSIPSAIATAAEEMATYVPDNAVLVPMPNHLGEVNEDTDTMVLARAIGELTNRPVIAALRGEKHNSRREVKKQGYKGPKVTAENMGFHQVMDLPEGTIPIFIDNVVASGETAKAATQAMGGGITLAYSKTVRSPGIVGLKNAIVTYDDQDNLIPLSQRFDASVRNVRYSYAQNKMDTVEQGLYDRIENADRTEKELRAKHKELTSTEEYKQVEQQVSEAKTKGEMSEALKAYQEWEVNTDIRSIIEQIKVAEEEKKQARKELEQYVEERDLKAEQDAIRESGKTEADWRRDQAVKEFGYTGNYREAGYMLPNGKMLNFSGEKGKHTGHRGQDHRNISVLYAAKQGGEAMDAFMADGNIRVMAETPGIDIIKEPTTEQYSQIRDMARRFAGEEYFNVDFSDEKGRNIGSLEYDGAVNPARIVNDIKTFFKTGEIAEQSVVSQFHYSIAKNDMIKRSEETKDQRIKRINEKQNNAMQFLDQFREDDSGMDADAFMDAMGDNLYPALRQWIHNRYQKGRNKGRNVIVSAVRNFINDDIESVRNDKGNITKEWSKIKGVCPKGIDVTQTHTSVNVRDLHRETREALFGKQSTMCDVKNKDTHCEIRINNGTINESYQYSKHNGIPYSVTQKVLSNAKELLREAIYIGSRDNYLEETDGKHIHYFVNQIKDGEYVDAVVFCVHDAINDSDTFDEKAYVTEIMLIENENGPGDPLRRTPRKTATGGPQELHPVSFSEKSIAEIIDAVNTDEIRYFDKKALEGRGMKLSISESQMDVNSWMMGLSEGSLRTESERQLLRAYKDLKMKIKISDQRLRDYNEKLRSLERKGDALTYEEREDARALRNKIETESAKNDRLAEELSKVTSSEGYAGMMYEQNEFLQNNIYGKSQEQVRQAVDELVSEIQKSKAEIAKRQEALRKLAESEAVQFIRSQMSKTSLEKAAKLIRKELGSTMNKQYLMDRLSELSLRAANGENIVDDSRALAEEVAGMIKGEQSENLEPMRGMTFYISPSVQKELKAENSNLKEIRSRLKGSGIKIQVAENGKFDEQWAEFREYNMGLPNLDEEYAEIDKLHKMVDFIESQVKAGREMYQGQLDIDYATAVVMSQASMISADFVTDPAAKRQMQRLSEYINKMRQESENAADAVAKIEQRMDELLESGTKAKGLTQMLEHDVGEAIKYFNETSKMAAQVERQKVKENIIDQLKSENTRKLIQQQEEFRERLKKDRRARELQADNEALRSKTNTVFKRIRNLLVNETDQKNIPEEAKPLARMLAGMIVNHDLGGNRKVSFIEKKQLMEFQNWLDTMKRNNGEFDAGTDLEWLVVGEGEGRDTYIRDKVMQDLLDIETGLLKYTTAEGQGNITLADRKAALEMVQKAASEIMSVIQARRSAFISGKRVEVNELASQMEKDMEHSRFKGERTSKTGKAREKAVTLLNYGNLTPEYFFKNLRNNTMSLLYDQFHQAENRAGLEAAKAQAVMAQIAEETGYAGWDTKKRVEVKLSSGKVVRLNLGEMMSLYATWKRESMSDRVEETSHLLNGGFVINDQETKLGGKKQRVEQRPIRVNEADMGHIAGLLTEQQKSLVDRVVEYMSGDLAELGNEASMNMFGVRKFEEKYYFPIKSWEGNLNRKEGQGIANSDTRNRGMQQGFSKRIKAGSNNALEIGDFMATAVNHIVGMINYNTTGPAVENLNRVLNAKLTYGDVEMLDSGEEQDNTYKRNVRAAFQENYGQGAYGYLKTFLNDINGGTVQDHRGDELYNTLLSMFKKNAVAGSLSVAAQQPLSYIRAAMLIDPKYLAQAVLPQYWKGSYAEMMQHSGVAVIKAMGKFDMNFGQSMKDWIMPEQEKSKARAMWDWLSEKSTALPEKMDAMTWTRMWSAVKLEQHQLNPEMDMKSDAFLDKVGERFNEVMRRTQVYDSILVKSQLMRSNTRAAKTLTSFMGEPTLTLNVLEDALQNRNEEGGKAYLAKAGATYVLGAIAQAAAKGFFGAGRRPDKDKTWLENFLNKLGYNLVSEINPLGLIPGYNNVVELLEKGELQDDAYGVIGKAKDIYDTVMKYIKEGGSGNTYQMIEDSVGQFVQLFTNVPAKNIMRDVRAMANFFGNALGNNALEGFTGGNYAQRESSAAIIKYNAIDTLMSNDIIGLINSKLGDAGYKTDDKAYYQRLYEAKKTGDTTKAEELFEYLSKGKGKSESAISKKMAELAKADESMDAAETAEFMLEEGREKSTTDFTMDQVRAGEMSEEDARRILKEANPDMDADTIWWKVDRAAYQRDTGKAASGNYYRMYDAIETGKNDGIRSAVTGIIQHGVDKDKVRKQIGNKYKTAYLEATGSEKVKLKNSLIFAYKATGLTDAEANKIINGWKEKKKKDGSSLVPDAGSQAGKTREPIGLIGSANGAPKRQAEEDTTGRYGEGNIDLNRRKKLDNGDGSFSTERSFSFWDEDEGKEVLIPQVIDGRLVSEDEAIDHYYETGEYLGKFDTPEAADSYAEKLHKRQEWYYKTRR